LAFFFIDFVCGFETPRDWQIKPHKIVYVLEMFSILTLLRNKASKGNDVELNLK
jgi:hypothetical protein